MQRVYRNNTILAQEQADPNLYYQPRPTARVSHVALQIPCTRHLERDAVAHKPPGNRNNNVR